YGLEAHDLVFARGDTPLGVPGQLLVDEQLQVANQLREALPLYRRGEALAPQAVDIVLPQLRVTGWLDACYPTGRIVVKSQIHSRDVFRAWVEHLALCAMQPAGMVLNTRWLSPERVFTFAPLTAADAVANLSEVTALYEAAMSAPLPFFPHSALAWGKADDDDQRWDAALKRWLPSFTHEGEWAEAQNQLLWPDDPFSESLDGPVAEEPSAAAVFVAWAGRIMTPLLAAVIDHDLASDMAMLTGEDHE
ncbi:MAG: hypothetical protein ACRC6G_03500, partial [Deefgea sp.]